MADISPPPFLVCVMDLSPYGRPRTLTRRNFLYENPPAGFHCMIPSTLARGDSFLPSPLSTSPEGRLRCNDPSPFSPPPVGLPETCGRSIFPLPFFQGAEMRRFFEYDHKRYLLLSFFLNDGKINPPPRMMAMIKVLA